MVAAMATISIAVTSATPRIRVQRAKARNGTFFRRSVIDEKDPRHATAPGSECQRQLDRSRQRFEITLGRGPLEPPLPSFVVKA
jgi:hypothetical protein